MSESAQALSVSAALSIAKERLESITVKVIGEVSELSDKAGYKAVYFTIKDKSASMPCMMWNNRYKASGVKLSIGTLVELTGRFSLYAAKGRMNFDVFSVALAGEGNLRIQVANLAKKLEAEGLMAPERKRALPRLPLRIGLVTSPRGAAVYDVLRTLRRRYPLAEVLVAGVPVEGAQAPVYLQEGLHELERAGAEVILLVRGGGSFEDLMPFNDEALARTIAGLRVPVVTGIGHEPDTSIADMVADVRASTPTAAAEAVSQTLDDVSAGLRECSYRLNSAINAKITTLKTQLLRSEHAPVFTEPMRLLNNAAQAIDGLARRLAGAIPEAFSRRKAAVEIARVRLLKEGDDLLQRPSSKVQDLGVRIRHDGHMLLHRFKEQESIVAAKLEGLSPLKVLARGYSMVFAEDGSVISEVENASCGQEIRVRMVDGSMGCTIDRIDHDGIGSKGDR